MTSIQRTAEATFAYFAILLVVIFVGHTISQILVINGLPAWIAQAAGASFQALLLIWASGFALRSLGVPSSAAMRICIGVGAVMLLLLTLVVLTWLAMEHGVLRQYWRRAIFLGEGMSPAVTWALLALAAALPLIRAR